MGPSPSSSLNVILCYFFSRVINLLYLSHHGPGDASVPEPSEWNECTLFYVSLFSSVIFLRVVLNVFFSFYLVDLALLGFHGLGDFAIPYLL